MKGSCVTRRKKKGPARGTKQRGGGIFNIFKSKQPVPVPVPAPINNSQPKQLAEPTDNSEKTNVKNLNRKLINAAGSYGSIDIVNKLLEDGADVNTADANGTTALMSATYKGLEPVVKVLLAAGADVNTADANGKTALMIAADSGWPAIVDMLLAKGADLNKTDVKGWTALMYVVDSGRKYIIEMLLAKGADVNTADAKGKTVLMIAADSVCITPKRKCSSEIIRLLLSAGADVNATDVNGMTALMWAVSHGPRAAERVEVLLAAGANVNASNINGKTALNITNSDRIKSILQKAKANQNPAPTGNAVPQMGATINKQKLIGNNLQVVLPSGGRKKYTRKHKKYHK